MRHLKPPSLTCKTNNTIFSLIMYLNNPVNTNGKIACALKEAECGDCPVGSAQVRGKLIPAPRSFSDFFKLLLVVVIQHPGGRGNPIVQPERHYSRRRHQRRAGSPGYSSVRLLCGVTHQWSRPSPKATLPHRHTSSPQSQHALHRVRRSGSGNAWWESIKREAAEILRPLMKDGAVLGWPTSPHPCKAILGSA